MLEIENEFKCYEVMFLLGSFPMTCKPKMRLYKCVSLSFLLYKRDEIDFEKVSQAKVKLSCGLEFESVLCFVI